MEDILKAILDRLDAANRKLDALDQQIQAIDAKIITSGNSLGKSLSETTATLGAMKLG
jgi:hypothetical protein